jgi:hypothetical protein
VRNDYKHPWWFACKNDFFINPNFLDFTLEERLTFIYLLCIASQQAKSGAFEVDETVFNRMTGIKSSHLNSTLKKLVEKQVLVGICTESVQNPTESVLTEHNITKQNTLGVPPEMAFEEIFKTYPKRKGDQRKKTGFQKLKKIVKTGDDLELVKRAVNNYSAFCSREKKTGTEFVKQFGTFFDANGDWKEWAEGSQAKPFKLKTLEDMKNEKIIAE